MGLGRGVLIVLLLAPVLAPGAQSAPTYTFEVADTSGQVRGNQGAGTPGEYRIGETVRLRVLVVGDGTQSDTLTNRFTLFKGASVWGEVGTGALVTTALYGQTIISFDWPTTALSSADAGKWHARFSTPSTVLFAFFDLDHAPDFTVTHVRVTHPPFFVPWTFARDGTNKIVEGCVQNLGPDYTPRNVPTSLIFRTHAEFLINSPGRVVQTSTVYLDSTGIPCTAMGFPYPGQYVRFDWAVLTHSVSGSLAMYRVGIRADALNTMWEVNENNNMKDVESTVLPFVFLP